MRMGDSLVWRRTARQLGRPAGCHFNVSGLGPLRPRVKLQDHEHLHVAALRPSAGATTAPDDQRA
jgi:hypothetical protein